MSGMHAADKKTWTKKIISLLTTLCFQELLVDISKKRKVSWHSINPLNFPGQPDIVYLLTFLESQTQCIDFLPSSRVFTSP